MSRSKRDKVTDFLFHLGKGLWKSVPVLGSIVEEVIYVQYEEELKSRVYKLDDSEIQTILKSMPDFDSKRLEDYADKLTIDLKINNMEVMTALLTNYEENQNELLGRFDELDIKVAPIPNILGMLEEIKSVSGDQEAVLIALNSFKEKREKRKLDCKNIKKTEKGTLFDRGRDNFIKRYLEQNIKNITKMWIQRI